VSSSSILSSSSLATDRCVFVSYSPNKSSTVSFLPSSHPICGTRSSSTNSRCPIAIAYGTVGGPNANGSEIKCNHGFEGDIAYDKLSFGGSELLSTTVPFVSITTIQDGSQKAPAAGIMGVAFKSLNAKVGSFSQYESLRTIRCWYDRYSYCIWNTFGKDWYD
jgi:hypothetical protein